MLSFQPASHVSLSSLLHPQGRCNLAVNSIIQIAEYLMVLKHILKELYYLFTQKIPPSPMLFGSPVKTEVHLQHTFN